MLVASGGLPGTGKTTLARALARRLDAVPTRSPRTICFSAASSSPIGSTRYRSRAMPGSRGHRHGEHRVDDQIALVLERLGVYEAR